MLGYLEYLNVPTKIGISIVLLFLVTQVIGELIEFKGKFVPEVFKVRKYFSRKKREREETAQTLREVKQLLEDVNAHYSADNIAKRDDWMNWVNSRAVAYDNFIVEISDKFSNVTEALNNNTRMTEEMFIQSSRDRIIDFATKVGNEDSVVSREEFCRIFKVYDSYENFLEERDMTNGEIDIAYRIIRESYEKHMKNHSFIENKRGYDLCK